MCAHFFYFANNTHKELLQQTSDYTYTCSTVSSTCLQENTINLIWLNVTFYCYIKQLIFDGIQELFVLIVSEI